MRALQKGTMTRMQLEAAEAHPRAREILAALDPQIAIEIRATGANDWISVGHMCKLMQAAYDVGGETLARGRLGLAPMGPR